MTKNEFQQMVLNEENQKRVNASDAQLEEMFGTPKRKHYPEADWDRFPELRRR